MKEGEKLVIIGRGGEGGPYGRFGGRTFLIQIEKR